MRFSLACDISGNGASARLVGRIDVKMMTMKILLAAVTFTAALAISRPVAAQDPVAKGAQVYTAQKCQICQAIGGKGNKQNPLDGVGKKLTADDIRQWITHPAEMTAKTKSTKKPVMPNKYANLPAADLDALTAYLASLK
jgi:mono/diheme cytochrome c family protein